MEKKLTTEDEVFNQALIELRNNCYARMGKSGIDEIRYWSSQSPQWKFLFGHIEIMLKEDDKQYFIDVLTKVGLPLLQQNLVDHSKVSLIMNLAYRTLTKLTFDIGFDEDEGWNMRTVNLLTGKLGPDYEAFIQAVERGEI